jgi:2-phosphosulfolactate phosphatase
VDQLFSQGGYDLRFDWGVSGAEQAQSDLAVVVDVLSFSTAVCIAVDRGMVVYPYRWADESAQAFARERDAFLPVGRRDALRSGRPEPSLSPSALLACEPVPRLVLPSPNGSSIAEALRLREIEVAVGCLRNASATARHVQNALHAGRSVTFIAAGERWAGGTSLRPCLEDHLGAGAALAALATAGFGDRMSPEARAAALLFSAHASTLGQTLRDCVSGKELDARGFYPDVAAAAELDTSPHVPVLRDGAFAAH